MTWYQRTYLNCDYGGTDSVRYLIRTERMQFVDTVQRTATEIGATRGTIVGVMKNQE